MEVMEAILARRSIRKFTQEPVPQEAVEVLLQAAMAGPSAMNRQPWEFYVVRNPEVQQAIRDASPYGKMNSTLMIVAAGNRDRAITSKDNDFWIQDCSAAIENILLAAVELGLGACWCGLYPAEHRSEKIREILGAGENIVPLGLIQLGYPDQTQPARTQYDEAKVHII